MQDTESDRTMEPLLALGLIQPRFTGDQALEALNEIGGDRAAALLHGHKVTGFARDTACRLARTAPPATAKLLVHLDQCLAEKSARMAPRWSSAAAVERLVTDAADREGVSWWKMKGFSFRRRYPAGVRRDVGDLDVLVASIDDAWRLARRLRCEGYGYPAGELPWFKRDIREGSLYGQIRLTDPAGARLSIDIHAGPYSVRHCAMMPLRRSRGAAAADISLDDDICSVVANAAGDCMVNAKLVNDLVLVLDKDFDADYVLETLDAAGLLPFLATCMARLAAWSVLTPEQDKGRERLTPYVGPEPMPPLVAADPRQRCEVTVAHARAIAERMLPDAPGQVAAIVETARAAYGVDHPLRIADLPRSASASLPPLNNWTCVRLVPVDLAASHLPVRGDDAEIPAALRGREALSEQLNLLHFDEGVAVQCADDLFLPTVDYVLPEGLVRAAAAR